jgi:hypothetical protein
MYNPSNVHLDMNTNSIQGAYDVTLHSLTKNPQTTGTDIKVLSSLDLDPYLNARKNIVGVNNIETKLINGASVLTQTNITDEAKLRTDADTALQGQINLRATTTALTTETNARTIADTALQDQINLRATTTALTTETNARTTADTALQNQITTITYQMCERSDVKSNAITTPATGVYGKIKGGIFGTGAEFQFGTNHIYRICYTLALTTASTGKDIMMRVVFGNTTTGTASVIVSTGILEFIMDFQIGVFTSSTQITIHSVSKLTCYPSSGATPTVNVIETALSLDLLTPNVLFPSIELTSSSMNIGAYTMTRLLYTFVRVA